MKIYCISEGELYLVENGKCKTIPCDRITNYLDTLKKLRQRDEWKTSGKGAKFMGVTEKEYGDITAHGEPLLRSVSSFGDKLVYSTYIDGMGGMYIKNTDDYAETYIFANKEFDLTNAYIDGDKCVITAAFGEYERHIASVDISNGGFDQLTDGFTSETHPFISKKDNTKIYYSAMGYARNQNGFVVEKSPCSICCYDETTGELSDILENSEYDYLKPRDDEDGNLYYIRRKYEPMKNKGNLLLDILLFPVRIIKAIGGFLSVFSMAFGGEPLRSGGKNPAKSRTADEREIFVEGNMIKAQKKRSEDSDDGIIPSGWELIKNENGAEKVLKKGVMDYFITDDGDIIYSNGSALRILRKNGKDEKICKLSLANSLTVI